MPFLSHISILDLIIKGLLIGILASAPMGPVGVLCVQRTLNKGRWYGFITGLGAAVSDIIYALITGFGMSFVMELIQNPRNKFILQLLGSFLLMCFGIYCFLSKPKSRAHVSGNKKGTLVHNGVTAFLITFSNLLIIPFFISLYAQFAFVIPNHPFEMSIGYVSVFCGAILWWLGLTWLVNKVRGKFGDNIITIINKVIGTVVIIVSLAILIGTIFHLQMLPTEPGFMGR